ncbi:MAG TPA: VOC family protein [Thermoleophilaceae bacterium]
MAVNRLDHAAIRVEDIGEALVWYVDALGLTLLDRRDDQAHLTCRGDHADLTLVTGGRGPVSFAIGVDGPDDLDELEQRLTDHGVVHERVHQPLRPGTSVLTRFTLPTGHTIEYSVASDGRTAGETDLSWDGVSAAPTDIDHINLLGDAAPSDVLSFLTEVVGFRYSGSVEHEGELDAIWTRGGRLDHDVAYMRAARPGDRLHHVAFAMADSNHYARLGDRLADHGYMFEFGPGRHGGGYLGDSGFGSNLFAYAFDPSGNRNEFSGDMKTLADDAVPVVQSSEQIDKVMNVWAKNMPESFITIGS